MSIKSYITDARTGQAAVIDDATGESKALVVATRPLKTFVFRTAFFTNDTYGREMAQNAAFGAVNWTLADGNDTTSADTGTADTNTLNHVIQAAQNFESTTSVGMTVHNTTGGLYGNVTVVNSDTDLTCDSDVCPLGTENFVIAPDWTFTEPVGTKWVDGDVGQFHAGAASLLCDNANVGDIMQLENVNGIDVDMSNFAAITMWIYVDKDWQGNDSFSLYSHQGGATVGNKVYLEDYFPFGEYDAWHYINIPLADLGIDALLIDALLFENEDRQGGKSPKFWIDEITLQASGAAIEFTIEPDKGTWFHITSYQTTFVGVYDADNADGTMPNLSYDKLLGMTPTSGYKYERFSSDEPDPIFIARVTSLMDLLHFPRSNLSTTICDGTNTMITIGQERPEQLILKSENLDRAVMTIEDDFSELLYFRVSAQGYVETR